jgi:hypothetical protein
MSSVTIKDLISRSSLANLIAGVIILVGAVYFVYTKDGDSLKWMVGLGLGWLLKEIPGQILEPVPSPT